MVAIQFFSTALFGLIYSYSFKPIGFWFAAPIAFALLFHQLGSGKFPILHSFIFGFTANLMVLSWTSTFVGSLPWLLLVFLQALFFIPLGISARFTKQVPIYILVMIASESIKSRFPFGGFGWTRVAFSQVDSPLAPLVSIAGVTFLSAATLFIAFWIVDRSKFASVLLLGCVIFAQLSTSTASSADSIHIRAVQGGVPERGLEFNARAMEVLDNHIDATLSEIDSKDELIIWPENAIDVDPLRNSEVSKKIKELTSITDTPLLAGAILDGNKLLNSTVLFGANGNVQSIYVKRYLTPFGEYIPLRSIASRISPQAGRVTDFSTGDRLVIHEVDSVRVGSVICYEILNDGLVREIANNSSFLVVHTNSATFAGSSEGEQQLAITRLRAIESGKSIVSVSTTGPSAIIDARGVVRQQLLDGQVGSVSALISPRNGKSLSMKLGGFGEISVLLLLVMWSTASVIRRRRQ